MILILIVTMECIGLSAALKARALVDKIVDKTGAKGTNAQ
jgi:6-phosphogluconate dehydrogenase